LSVTAGDEAGVGVVTVTLTVLLVALV
jgi:hypothetical protein